MCGIAGIVSRKEINKELFEQMTDMVTYRGPDDRGTWYGEGIALGHRRLSIIDLSELGHQPFFYGDRFVLVYNGEIYNYIELREELIAKGYKFVTACDTEVVAASYACWGADCVNRFNGMWGFAIYDMKSGLLFCSRDRFGVKPFYYYYDENDFIFGSEIKQIIHMRNTKTYADKQKLMEYLIYGMIDTSADTMFKGIRQLMPGESGIIDIKSHSLKINRYYDVNRYICGKKKKISYNDACREFLNCYRDAVRLRLRSDVNLGFCLSGGLDSSSNVCVAREVNDKITQETVTYCSTYKAYDEQEYADVISEHVGSVVHKTYSDAEGLFGDIDDFIWHNDEPFGSTSIFASWCTFKEAYRSNLTVMIDGQGADEQLAGYTDYFPAYFVHLFHRGHLIKYIKEIAAYYGLRKDPPSYLSLKNMVLSPLAFSFLPESFVRNKKIRQEADINMSPFTEEEIAEVYLTERKNPYRDPVTYLNDTFGGLLSLLHCEDRTTMAHSIESRLPFLDYRLVEMLGGVPISYKIKKGMTKALMRDALKGILPDKVRLRISKFGFVTPEDQWINSNLEMFDKEILSSIDLLSENGIMDKDRAITWWNIQKGNVKRGYRLPWRMLCAAHWMRMFDLEVSKDAV